MASSITQEVGLLDKDYEVDIGLCATKVSLYTTTLGSYDIIVCMDWLEDHEAMLDCKDKKLIVINDLRYKRILVGTKRVISLRFISALKLKKSLKRGCELYAIIAMNNKDDTMDVSQHAILSKFCDVLPEEFL